MRPPSIPGADEELTGRVEAGLARVTQRLEEVVDHDDPFVSEANHHLAGAGGKGFRPLLTLLASEVGDGWDERVVDAAVGVELTHLASLYHDDVMDEAELRRGVESANARYGNSTAILVGDLLFGTASSVVAGLGAEAVRIQADTFVRLCAGQIRDDRQADAELPSDQAVQAYLEILEDKTGALIATAARYGAMFGGCDEATTRTLTAYGEKVGVVFQLADDLLDVASDAQVSGKTPGTDLREGKATLPVLYARGSEDPADARLLELTRGPVEDADELAEALTLLRAHPAMTQAREHTLRVAAQARELLEGLPDSPAVAALRALVDGVADRSR
ncbi:geranylgeranyl pyrophosphate synthase [Serinicoccus sp. CNJ-927]|uniref:polyprenyl synthetase family protein n=1 Tax=Serinicoccus sp. CNJ-927 TaxID=1904970 RepID=UPI000960A8C3|nr:polyprenyl synthetase family protein [Serinicoccus sp. CNJ-927]OLT44949.1 geranylgeranyl pyrophosphate synthase [Serinicoccus sp. CNJ-927]